MDSSVALLSSPASLGCISSKLKELKAKRKSRTGAEQEGSGVASPALTSNTTAVPAHSLLRTSSIEAPRTPRMNSCYFRTRLFRRPSSEEHTVLLGSSAGQSTQQEKGVLLHSSTTVYAYEAHSSTHSTQQATSSSSSSSSKPRKQVGCELPLTTRIKRHFAWTANVVQRQASCPATMQLQHLPTSRTSNQDSLSEAAPKQQQQQQQVMQPLTICHPLCGSQSWPGRHPALMTGLSSSSAAFEHPSTPPAAAAAAAPTQSSASFGSGSSVAATAWQPPPPCSEITVCDDSSDNSSAAAPDSWHSKAQHEAGSGDCPPAESYPECLFSDNPARSSSSFTTKVHTNNQGQQVAVVRSGGTIIAAFVKGPSGQVWECDPPEVDFTGSSCSQTQTAAAGTEHAAVCYTGGKGSSGVLTAYAAARAYHALNRSSRSSCSSSSSGCSRRGWGSSISSASETSPSSRSSSGSNRLFSSHISAGSMPGACSRTASNKSSVSGLSCSSSSHSSTASNQQKRRSLFAFLKDRIAELWQQRKVQQQRQAAAYLEELDEAARLSMRLAGCDSFVLPRHWSASARKQAKEQRRLRVLLAAYRA